MRSVINNFINHRATQLSRLGSVARICAVAALVTVSPLTMANGYSNVSVNGVPLTQHQLAGLERQLGGRVPAGNYVLAANGCWMNLNSGARGCFGGSNSGNGSGDVHSRYGSGSRNGNGDWNHWSDLSKGGVGGTSDGCIYTTYGWSNC